MEVTGVKFRRFNADPKGKWIAKLSITLDRELAVHDIFLMRGKEKPYVQMPNQKKSDSRGSFRQDTVHPICADFRVKLENRVLEDYGKLLKSTPAPHAA